MKKKSNKTKQKKQITKTCILRIEERDAEEEEEEEKKKKKKQKKQQKNKKWEEEEEEEEELERPKWDQIPFLQRIYIYIHIQVGFSLFARVGV